MVKRLWKLSACECVAVMKVLSSEPFTSPADSQVLQMNRYFFACGQSCTTILLTYLPITRSCRQCIMISPKRTVLSNALRLSVCLLVCLMQATKEKFAGNSRKLEIVSNAESLQNRQHSCTSAMSAPILCTTFTEQAEISHARLHLDRCKVSPRRGQKQKI